MTKEEGTQPTEDVLTEPTQDAEPKSPDSQAKPSDLPPELEGKSVEELAKMWKDSQSHIDKIQGENKDYREKLSSYDRLAQEEEYRRQQSYQGYNDPYMQPPVNPYTQQMPQQPAPEFNFENPYASIQPMINQTLGAYHAYQEQMRAAQHEQDARMNFEQGFVEAKTKNPKLYEGIEDDVRGQVFQLAKGMGTALPPQWLRDPSNWEKIAVAKRWERGEHDRLAPQNINPVPTVQTEIPQGASPDGKQPTVFNQDIQAEAKDLGLTTEEIEEAIQLGQETVNASKYGD